MRREARAVVAREDLLGGEYAFQDLAAGQILERDPLFFDAEPRERGIETIRVIMKDGQIYKNTL